MNHEEPSGKYVEQPMPQGVGWDNFVDMGSHGFYRMGLVRRYDRVCFVKMLVPQYASEMFYRRMLRKEFDMLSRLDIESVVRALDFIENSPMGGPALVMEYVDGITLADYLETDHRRGERTRLAGEIAAAVGRIHRAGVVHRDLKPHNIMLSRQSVSGNQQSVKIIDFGLADTPDSAVMKQPAGNTSYAAPEQLDGQAADSRSDIYSLGLIIKQLRPSWAWRLAVRKACRKDASKRYSTVEQLLGRVRLIRRLQTVITAVFVVAVAFGVWQLFVDDSRGETPTQTMTAVTPTDSVMDVDKAEIIVPVAATTEKAPTMPENTPQGGTLDAHCSVPVDAFATMTPDEVMSVFRRDVNRYYDLAMNRGNGRLSAADSIDIRLMMVEYDQGVYSMTGDNVDRRRLMKKLGEVMDSILTSR